MSEIKTSSGIEQIHGKTNGRDSGYFYMRNGKQKTTSKTSLPAKSGTQPPSSTPTPN